MSLFVLPYDHVVEWINFWGSCENSEPVWSLQIMLNPPLVNILLHNKYEEKSQKNWTHICIYTPHAYICKYVEVKVKKACNVDEEQKY